MSGPGHAHSFLNSSVQVGAFECPNFPRPSLCKGWVGCSLLCLKCNCSPPVVAGCYSFILLGLCNIPAAFPTLSFKLAETKARGCVSLAGGLREVRTQTHNSLWVRTVLVSLEPGTKLPSHKLPLLGPLPSWGGRWDKWQKKATNLSCHLKLSVSHLSIPVIAVNLCVSDKFWQVDCDSVCLIFWHILWRDWPLELSTTPFLLMLFYAVNVWTSQSCLSLIHAYLASYIFEKDDRAFVL